MRSFAVRNYLRRETRVPFIVIAAVIALFSTAIAPLNAQGAEKPQQLRTRPSDANVSPIQTPPPSQSPAQKTEVQSQSPARQSASHTSQATVRQVGVSFNFDDADVFDVIQTIFGEILKVNYMVDPRIRGRVNFRTTIPIPKEDVLPITEAILKLDDAGFVEEKGLYKILPLGDIPGTTPEIFVYPLQNSKASNIAPLLQSILTGSAVSSAQAPAQRSAAHTPAAISASPRPAASTSASGTGLLVSPETRVLADEITNSLIVLATPADYTFIEKTIKKIDTTPRQVMIEVLIAEVTLQDQFQFGLEWLLSNDVTLKHKAVNLSGVMGQNSDALLATDPTKGLAGFSYIASDAAGKVKALLQALASESKLNVLASPHILAADNREARIQIGDQVPIATSQSTAVGTSNSILTTIQYKDTGTILKVKPQINESGLVALDITQEVSDFSPLKVLGSDQFIFSKREAATNLVAQDGQTIVIGGLIRSRGDRTQSGIPLLSKIPVLGYLFGATTNSKTKTELIVLLTPHVIRNQQEAGVVSSEYLERLKGTDKEINVDEFVKKKKPQAPGNGGPEGKNPSAD